MLDENAIRIRLYISKQIRSLYAGDFASKSTSLRGFDFQEKKTFSIGDDPRAINIFSTIKDKEFKVSVKKVEKSANICILIDCSPSLLFGSSESKLNFGLRLIKTISLACLGGGNRVKLIAFTNKVEYEGPFVFTGQAAEEELYTIAKLKPLNKGSDLKMALKYLLENLAEGSSFNFPNLIFVVSDLILPLNFNVQLSEISERSNVVVLTLRDPTEIKLPRPRFGLVELADPETGKRFWARGTKDPLDNIAPILKKYEVDCLGINTQDDIGMTLEKLAELFEGKKE